MKKRHYLLHALVLTILIFLSIAIGFFFWKLVGGRQIMVQSLVGVLIANLSFWMWIKWSVARGIRVAENNYQATGFWILSLLLPAIIFVPLHYFTQGYLTSWGNISAITLYVIPVNFNGAWLMLRETGNTNM